MKFKNFFHLILLFVFAVIPPLHAQDSGPALSEKEKTEALISNIENLKDAKFIRNGSDYDAKTAAKFLRGKWKSNAKTINTAGDFIDKAATGSSTSGKPYLIRFKEGKEIKCSEYLKTELQKLNKPPGEKKP